MEIWGDAKVATMREKMRDVPEIIPENLGTIGYDGTDGLFVKSREKDMAYQAEGWRFSFTCLTTFHGRNHGSTLMNGLISIQHICCHAMKLAVPMPWRWPSMSTSLVMILVWT
jgi:hypothetical protein